MARRMKLPNGFGQISEIKGRKLRKPFRAMVTVGKNEKGRPICRLLKPEAYFKTYNEAYMALMEYNKSPYDFSNDITFEELYERWFAVHSKKVKTTKSIVLAWKYCWPLYKYNVRDIKAKHLRELLDTATIVSEVNGEVHHITPTLKQNVKMVLNLMYDYAVEYEIVEKNIARNISAGSVVTRQELAPKRHHKPFTYYEMTTLWQNQGNIIVDMLLIDCYSGWRPMELCNLTVNDIDLIEGTMKGGMKTEAGRNRVVPIHSAIKPLVIDYYNLAKKTGSEYIFTSNGRPFTYSMYYKAVVRTVEQLSLDPEHKTHDCRKHFITACKKSNVDEYAIKYLVGHTIKDLTERVYTERSIEWLKTEIEKIKSECRNGV